MSSLSQEYIKEIFSDKLKYEKEVLQVNCDEDRKEIMTLMCKELCSESKIIHEINFLKIKSINNLKFDNVVIGLVEILLSELLSLLKEKRYTKTEIDNIKKNNEYLKFIYELAKIYLHRFSNIFYKEVVNSFFDLVGTASKPEGLNPVVLEVIKGSENKKSLLEMHGGGKVLHKPEQAWMRVKQAKDDKNRQVKIFQLEIVKLVKRIDELKLNISAIVASKALSLNDVKHISSRLLLDMFTDEHDIQLHIKKIMFSYIASAELINVILETARNAKNQTSQTGEKNDFTQIIEYFNRCKKLNTKESVEKRFEEYKHELEVKSNKYREQRLKMKTLREKPLDSFDITLKKVKEAMVYNLQHP